MNTVTDKPLYEEASTWEGRNDGPGPEHARWHNVVQPDSAPQDGVAVIGFASDEGVGRNGGRQGAAAGPDAIRSALGSLAIHDDTARYDAGTVTTQGDDLESAQDELSNRVQKLIEDGNLTVVMGGGHETAWASHRGAFRATGAPLKIINLDAHYDLREENRPTSGTPFLQIANFLAEENSDSGDMHRGFDYTVFGISRPNNTRVLFDTARKLGVETVFDEELANLTPKEAGDLAAKAVANSNKPVHLTIDLDGLAASVAPGVSAPAGFGVSFAHYRAMAVAAAATGKVTLVDVVELNPTFDVDSRTAKAAARLVDDVVAAHVKATQ